MRRARPLAGQVVAITGAARGLGLATARELMARGAVLALGDRDEETLADAAHQLGPQVFSHPVDVTDEASFGAFIEAATTALGPIDVLINNAGIMPIGRFEEESVATARQVLEVNVLGCMIGMKAVLASMLERGSGTVVNIASVAAKTPVPGGASYCASKAAVLALTETTRVEYAGRGLTFTAVLPSFAATELISGTHGTKLIKTVSPHAVASAIAGALEHGQAEVYVPRIGRPLLSLQVATGRRIRDAMARGLGVDRVFLEIDHTERAAYDERVAPGEHAPH